MQLVHGVFWELPTRDHAFICPFLELIHFSKGKPGQKWSCLWILSQESLKQGHINNDKPESLWWKFSIHLLLWHPIKSLFSNSLLLPPIRDVFSALFQFKLTNNTVPLLTCLSAVDHYIEYLQSIGKQHRKTSSILL